MFSGDFGHVVSIISRDIEEGDSRYLAPELMNDDYGHLAKADIFSLGVTLHEAGSGRAMPKNGRLWREFRHDMARRRLSSRLPRYSTKFSW